VSTFHTGTEKELVLRLTDQIVRNRFGDDFVWVFRDIKLEGSQGPFSMDPSGIALKGAILMDGKMIRIKGHARISSGMKKPDALLRAGYTEAEERAHNALHGAWMLSFHITSSSVEELGSEEVTLRTAV